MRPNEFPIVLADVIGQKKAKAAEVLSTARENALAAGRGSDKPSFSIPEGTFQVTSEGETFDAAIPPYYLAVPLTVRGTSWRVPKDGFTVVRYVASEVDKPLRPALSLSIDPDSYHPTDPNVTINVCQAGWDPTTPNILYQIGDKKPIFSLSKKIQAEFGMTKKFTNTLTAGELLDFIADPSKWPSTSETPNDIIPWPTRTGIDVINLYHGMSDLTSKSVALRRFWKNMEARQVLSASLVMGDHHLLAAAIWSLLDVDQEHKNEFVQKKLEIIQKLKSGEIVDWDSYADAVEQVFADVNYPVTLSIGWTGLQSLVNQVMDWSLISETEQKTIVAKMMGVSDPASLNMIRGFNSDPVGLLVSSPQWVSGMTVLLRDLIGMAIKTTEIKGNAARKLMEAEQEVANLGLDMAKKLLEDLRSAYPKMSEIAGRIVSNKIAHLEQDMRDKIGPEEPPQTESRVIRRKPTPGTIITLTEKK